MALGQGLGGGTQLEVNLTRADLDGAEHLGEGVYRLANGQQVRFLSTATVH